MSAPPDERKSLVLNSSVPPDERKGWVLDLSVPLDVRKNLVLNAALPFDERKGRVLNAALPHDVRKGSAFPRSFPDCFEAAPQLLLSMIKISRDTPCYYLTSVAKDRLPVFQTAKIKQIVCNALDEARKSANILLFAYVIMPDHLHLITDSSKNISEVLRYTNGISAKRVIDYLKENNYTSSLMKLRQETKSRNYKHSLFEHHPNAFAINNEETFMQKVNYIHQNPVRGGLVEKAEDYEFSSARIWRKKASEEEPLKVDIDKIQWREA